MRRQQKHRVHPFSLRPQQMQGRAMSSREIRFFQSGAHLIGAGSANVLSAVSLLPNFHAASFLLRKFGPTGPPRHFEP